MLMLSNLVFIFFFFFTLVAKSEEVLLIKQWHLSPNEQTKDVESSKKKAQFQNQQDIYLKLASQIEKQSKLTLIHEGCEGDPAKSNHYGWTFEDLKARASGKDYADILAFLPNKLRAKYGDKISVICGDNEALIKKQLLAFSDLRGYTGYYQRLKEFKGKDEKRYKMFESSLVPKDKIGKVDAVQFAKEKILESLKNVESTIAERNDIVVAVAKKTLKDHPVVVIGGLHAKDLTQKFTQQGIPFTLYTPKGYVDQDEELLTKLKEGL